MWHGFFVLIKKTIMKNKKSASANPDLKESARDKEELKNDEANLDLPDVDDIPGQKKAKPLPPGLLGEDAASSSDEEGDDVFEENETDKEANVNPFERSLIDKAYENMSTDDEPVDQLSLDEDNEGEELNEKNLDEDLLGEDLDSPLIEEEEEEDDGENEKEE